MTPNANSVITIQRSVLDAETFEDVLLKKQVQFSPVTSVEEALARLGHDAFKLLAVVNDGLAAEIRKNEYNRLEGFFKTDESGEITTEAFSGTPLNGKDVNTMVLTLAKTIYGYENAKNAEDKRKAKDSAKSFIRATPAILDALKKKALEQPEETAS